MRVSSRESYNGITLWFSIIVVNFRGVFNKRFCTERIPKWLYDQKNRFLIPLKQYVNLGCLCIYVINNCSGISCIMWNKYLQFFSLIRRLYRGLLSTSLAQFTLKYPMIMMYSEEMCLNTSRNLCGTVHCNDCHIWKGRQFYKSEFNTRQYCKCMESQKHQSVYCKLQYYHRVSQLKTGYHCRTM